MLCTRYKLSTYIFCRFFEIFEKYDGYKQGHVKLKRPKQLQEILDISRALLAEIHTRHADPELEEKQGKLEQLKSVLEMWVYLFISSYNQEGRIEICYVMTGFLKINR